MFSWKEKCGLKYLEITEMVERGVKAVFTSRFGGISKGKYASLNLGLHTGDYYESVLENRKRIASVLKLDFKKFVAAEQVHGNNIYIVKEEDQGKGALELKNSIENVDALITDIRGIPLISFYADCVPLYIYDPVKEAVALSHAGWKGTFHEIGPKTVARMHEEYGTIPKDCIAAIGPSISGEKYEVGEKIINLFSEKFGFSKEIISQGDNSSYHLDLKRANVMLLAETGILKKNIVVCDLCTYKCNNLFYSYRRDNGETGRMASIIVL